MRDVVNRKVCLRSPPFTSVAARICAPTGEKSQLDSMSVERLVSDRLTSIEFETLCTRLPLTLQMKGHKEEGSSGSITTEYLAFTPQW